MLEVDVEIGLLCERGESMCESLNFGCAVSTRTAETIATKVCSGYVRGDEVFGVGDAEGCVVAAESIVGGVGEPAWVAELEGELEEWMRGEDWVVEEACETVGVCGEVWGKLEEERAELAGGLSGSKRSYEIG